MSKYKILWIDDKWEDMVSFKEVCELPENGFEVVACTNAVEGMKIFEKYLEDWSGVILDAKVLMDKDSQVDKLDGLTYSTRRILELSHKRYVPDYIFTGQPDTASGTAFAEEHKHNYYEKDKDEDRLISDIKKNAELLLETQIVHRHQVVFDTWPESRHDLIRILKILEDEEWQNNSVLNDVRKIMNDVMTRLHERGFCSIQHDGSNLAECSRILGQRYMEEIIPVYIQRAIHSCVEITNPGSHRSKTDFDVRDNKAPYLVRSLIYNMLDILYWCKNLPAIEMRDMVLKAVNGAKLKFEIEQQERENKRKNKTCSAL